MQTGINDAARVVVQGSGRTMSRLIAHTVVASSLLLSVSTIRVGLAYPEFYMVFLSDSPRLNDYVDWLPDNQTKLNEEQLKQ
jgi:hypothetical protein